MMYREQKVGEKSVAERAEGEATVDDAAQLWVDYGR